MTDFYRHRLAHAHWTWLEPKSCRFLHPLRRKDRHSGRAEKQRARMLERRDIEDQLFAAFDPLDDYDLCTDSCCAIYIPGLGITRKRWSE